LKPLILSSLFIFLSCSQDKEIFNNFKKAEIPISSASNINSVHTDSGKVSSILNSPKMLNFSNAVFPYYEFPNQLEVILFDKNNNKTNIVADYAISYSNSDLIDLRGNVIISTHLKDTLITDQLYYDRGQEWLFTNFDFRYVSLDKDIFGKGFDSDKSFEKIKFLEVNGFVSLDE
jgi:LPS export ABC transporter protein LptC